MTQSYIPAPWRTQLDATLAKNIEKAPDPFMVSVLQMSTVTTDGRPANRTIGHFGYVGEKPVHATLPAYIEAQADTDPDEKTAQIKSLAALGKYRSDIFVLETHMKTKKVAQIQENSAVELCWYFPYTGEQYRLRGNMHLLSSPSQAGSKERHRILDEQLRPFCHPVDEDVSPIPFDWETLRLNRLFNEPIAFRSWYTWDYNGQRLETLSEAERARAVGQMLDCPYLGEIPTRSPEEGGGLDIQSKEFGQTQHALANFALGLLQVEEVEYFNNNPATFGRIVYVRQPKDQGDQPGHSEWVKQTMIP
ncbi:hypothetical protein H4R33_006590 [Dimargaris cristalligena]|nr:hypothetical protein H4R33_006590 [Dimargaris cristalligena]